jgi:hypothetical protein
MYVRCVYVHTGNRGGIALWENRLQARDFEPAREVEHAAEADCCPSGKPLESMGCSEYLSWLECIGASVLSEAEERQHCSKLSAEILHMFSEDQMRSLLGLGQEDWRKVVQCRERYKTRGVVYPMYAICKNQNVAKGALIELRHSVFSLRKFPEHARWGLTVSVDMLPEECDTLYRDVKEVLTDLHALGVTFRLVDAEGVFDSVYQLRTMLHSPYQQTLQLDTDTKVCSPLTGLFEVLARFDMAATMAPALYYEGGPDPFSQIPEAYIQFNTGVIVMERSPRLEAMLRFAVEQGDRLSVQGYSDQAAFRSALWRHRDVQVLALDPRYQCRGAHRCTAQASPNYVRDQGVGVPTFAGNCIILHMHAIPDLNPQEPLHSADFVTKARLSAKEAWDEGLFTYELYPCGVPSRVDYWRSWGSPLGLHLQRYGEELCSRGGVGACGEMESWDTRWVYPFIVAAIRRHQRQERETDAHTQQVLRGVA